MSHDTILSNAVRKAIEESNTTVLCVLCTSSESEIFTSCRSDNKPGERHDVHAEEVFLNQADNKDFSQITSLYIKNSPCVNCSKKLIEAFKGSRNKPTIYIGRIYNLEDANDRNGLESLLMEGFKMEVWEEVNKALQSKEWPESEQIDEEKRNNTRAKRTHEYLQKLKQDYLGNLARECIGQLKSCNDESWKQKIVRIIRNAISMKK